MAFVTISFHKVVIKPSKEHEGRDEEISSTPMTDSLVCNV